MGEKIKLDANGNRTLIMPDGQLAVEMPGGQWVVHIAGTQADYAEIDNPETVYTAEMELPATGEAKRFIWKESSDRVAIIRYDEMGGYIECLRCNKETARAEWNVLLNEGWNWRNVLQATLDPNDHNLPLNVRNACSLLDSGE
jgi:hypothetical protein